MTYNSDKIYLTLGGLEKFRKELKKFREIRNAKIKDQEELVRLNERVEEIELILKSYELIKIPVKNKQNIVNLGATVIVEVDGQIDELTIVGTLEANPSLGKISNESPVGRALLNYKVGDEVMVSSAIKTVYKIKEIKYEL